MDETIYFITNRNPLPSPLKVEKFDHNFSSAGREDLRFGKVSVRDDGGIAEFYCLPDEPGEGSLTMLRELKGKSFEQGRPNFIFIHGYNTSWENACKAAASLKRAYAHLKPN